MKPLSLHSAIRSFFRCGRALIPAALWCWSVFFPATVFAASASPVPTITLAFANESMPPYYRISKDQQEIEGAWRRVLDSLFRDKLGWQVKYLLRPWQRAQYEVEQGTADAMITIVTEERLKFTTPVVIPFCCFPLHLFTWKDHPRLEEMRRLSSVPELAALRLTLVSNIGNGWYKNHVERKGVKTVWLPTDEQVIQFVTLKRADGFIDVPGSIADLAGKLGLTGQIVDTGTTFSCSSVHLLIGKSSPFAARIGEIETAMRALRQNGGVADPAGPSAEDHGTHTKDLCHPCDCGESR